MGKVISFLNKCKRVWHILRKPKADEFKSIAKVSSIGLLLLGLMGFLISLVMNFFS